MHCGCGNVVALQWQRSNYVLMLAVFFGSVTDHMFCGSDVEAAAGFHCKKIFLGSFLESFECIMNSK